MTRFRIKLPALWRQASAGLLAGAVAGRISLWLQDLVGLHAIALRHGRLGHPLVQVLSTPLYAA